MAMIFIEVHVPGNAKTYEFSIDQQMSIGTAKVMVIEQITAIENMDLYPDKQKALFCSIDLKGMIRGTETFASAGIKSGDKFILV